MRQTWSWSIPSSCICTSGFTTPGKCSTDLATCCMHMKSGIYTGISCFIISEMETFMALSVVFGCCETPSTVHFVKPGAYITHQSPYLLMGKYVKIRTRLCFQIHNIQPHNLHLLSMYNKLLFMPIVTCFLNNWFSGAMKYIKPRLNKFKILKKKCCNCSFLALNIKHMNVYRACRVTIQVTNQQ